MTSIRSERRPEIPKCELALRLHEKGVSPAAIAERLRIRQRDVSVVVKQGSDRRRRQKERAS